MDLNAAAIFVRVIQAGGFSAAARQLKMPVSTVSAKIRQLETDLGVSLIRRTTRQLHLTDAGSRFFERTARAISELQEAQASTSSSQDLIQGMIRITGPMEMGMTTLSDVVSGFLKRYPETQMDLLVTDRVVDLIGEGVDLAIRVGELEDSSLVAKKLGTTQFELFASPGYLKKAGTPAKPADLEQHQCLGFITPIEGMVWDLVYGSRRARVPIRGPFVTNSLASLHRLAVHGHGIARLPRYLCTHELERGRLVHVLPGWYTDQIPVHLVYPEQRFVPKRVRALIEYLSENLKEVF